MKTVKMTLILIFSLMVCISNLYAYDFGTNVTINDKRSNTGSNDGYSYTTPKEHGWWTTGKGQGGEDQEVEPGMWPLQKWDLEGFFLKDGRYLSIVGGFDFKNGVEGIRSGSIFIDVTGDAQYGSTANASVPNYGYEYAIDLNFGTSQYNVYKGAWIWDPVIETQNIPYSNPWRYRGGGELVTSGNFIYMSGLSDSDVGGFQGGNHYAVAGFDLSFLPAGTTFITHFTEECGNDNLMDDGKTVPEPATMLLLGLGLAGLAGVRRKFSN
jgi:hypothetical protein